MKGLALGALVTVAAVVACNHGDRDARYPARPAGCDVKVYPDIPDVPTDNIGPVNARCAEDIPKDDCLRTLQDAVCDLGGDVVWGIGDEPTHKDGKNTWHGRAAHTKTARPPTTPNP